MKDNNSNILLKTEALSIGYKTKRANINIVSNINLELKEGQLIALVGGNGAGKSTLLQTITQVLPKLSGDIYLKNKPLEAYASIELAKKMSLVLTEEIASKNLTVFELIALGRQPYTNWVGTLSKNDIKIINKAILQTNIEALKHKKCFQLSDGQLQKVLIARAIAQDTAIIILDEPTTHLDMYHKAYILNLLQKLAKETGKTILFSTHEIDLAIQLCNNIIVITKNTVTQNTPKHLIKQGVFNTLFPKDLITFNEKTESFKINK